MHDNDIVVSSRPDSQKPQLRECRIFKGFDDIEGDLYIICTSIIQML